MKVSEYAGQVVKKLNLSGYEAYFVGGCVRDILMGRRPNDYDVATSARPEEVAALFKRCIPTGIKHGTITVLYNRHPVEVTTYRIEGKYSDGRHPDEVKFVNKLERDLERRDFTINAMAMGLDGEIIDPFGGKRDILRRVVCCVGEPEKRFKEDALRIMRMLRFAAQLKFKIDEDTIHAAVMSAPLLNSIAAERIRDEVEKILLSNNPDMIGFAVLSGFLMKFGLGERSRLHGLKNVARTKLSRWSAFCSLSGENADMLRLFRLDGKTIRAVEKAFVILESGLPKDEAALKRLCREKGIAAVVAAAAMQDAKSGERNSKRLKDMLKRGECFTADMLAVGGDEIMQMGIKEGKKIGDVLNLLVDHVIDNPNDNNREKLLKLVVAMRDKESYNTIANE